MNYSGIFLISPLWGFISPKLFYDGWIAFLGILACVYGLLRGKLSPNEFAIRIFNLISRFIFSFLLLGAGFYIIYGLYDYGKSSVEAFVYFLAAIIQMVRLLPTVSERIDEILLLGGLSENKKP